MSSLPVIDLMSIQISYQSSPKIYISRVQKVIFTWDTAKLPDSEDPYSIIFKCTELNTGREEYLIAEFVILSSLNDEYTFKVPSFSQYVSSKKTVI